MTLFGVAKSPKITTPCQYIRIRCVLPSALFTVWMVPIQPSLRPVKVVDRLDLAAAGAFLPKPILFHSAIGFSSIQLEQRYLKGGIRWFNRFVARRAKAFQIAELVSLFVFGINSNQIAELFKGTLMVNIKRLTKFGFRNPTPLARVIISLPRFPFLPFPIWTIIIFPPSSPIVTILARLVFRAPIVPTLHATVNIVASIQPRRRNDDSLAAVPTLDSETFSPVRIFSLLFDHCFKKVLPAGGGVGVQATSFSPWGAC